MTGYDLSWPHIESERNFLYTANPALRRLVIDQVRRLHMGGAQVEAVQFGQDALKIWRERLGPDDLHVLMLAVEVAVAMRVLGSAAEARELSRETLRLLTERYGEDHEITLLCASLHGTDLRARAQFGEALELDLDLLPRFERVYGPDHERTLGVRAAWPPITGALAGCPRPCRPISGSTPTGGASWATTTRLP